MEMASYGKSDPRVLIVRPGALGDTILSLPLLDSIRRENPGSRIVFLGTRPYGTLIPPWAEFQPMDHPRWLWLFATEDEGVPSDACSFDRAYVVLNNPEHVMRNLRRAGVDSICYTSSRPTPETHVVEHLHRGLGLAVPTKIPALAHLVTGRTPLVWLHPGSGGPHKCVPLSFLIRFTDAFGKTVGEWPRAITAGEEDGFLAGSTEWHMLINGPGTRLLEHRPLLEVCAELGSSGLFIGNDSGVSHLAAALGVPSIVFFVSTDPSQWAPWGPPHQVKPIDLRGEKFSAADLDDLVSRTCDLARKWDLSQNRERIADRCTREVP